MGFNVTEYEMFIDMVPDSKFQLSFKKLLFVGNSMVVQSLRLCASTAGGMGFTPVWYLRSHRPCCMAKISAHTHTHNTHTHTQTHTKKETTICGVLV